MRRYLDQEMFVADEHVRGFDSCQEDDGDDNPRLGAAMVGARVLGHDTATSESSGENGRPVKRATWQVEVRSAGIIVPQWIGKFAVDTTARFAGEPYEGIIAPRTDTFSVTLGQLMGQGPAERGWVVCMPEGPAVSEGDGPGFWYFLHASDQPSREMAIVRWTPTDASWQRLTAVADSATRARRAP